MHVKSCENFMWQKIPCTKQYVLNHKLHLYTFESVLQTVRYCEWGQERLHDLAGGSRQWSQGEF